MTPKPVTVSLIDPRERQGPYVLLDSLVAAHHPDLEKASILVTWKSGWKADKDGHLVLAKIKRASELDRELRKHDFVILLNEEVWPQLSEEQQSAVLDHELSHGTLVYDEDGAPRKDERGRYVYRLRKHDLEEFRGVVARHGFYLDDVRRFAEVCLEKGKAALPLFAEEQAPPMTNGESNGQEAPWFRQPIASLDLPKKVIEVLVFAGCEVLGSLAILLAKDPELASVKGLNPTQAAKVRAELGEAQRDSSVLEGARHDQS